MPETPTPASRDDTAPPPSSGPVPPANTGTPRHESSNNPTRTAPVPTTALPANPFPPASKAANKAEESANGYRAIEAVPAQPAYRPSELRFRAGIRLLVHVTSITRQLDGSFTFQGTLLKPVTLAGAVSLDQNTQVLGLGTTKNGHVNVLLTRFTYQGENYRLQAASNPGKKPGSGSAIERDPGKVLDLWLESASVYERSNR